jgi:hypothetical protein
MQEKNNLRARPSASSSCRMKFNRNNFEVLLAVWRMRVHFAK